MTREHMVRELTTRMQLAASLTRALQLAQSERQHQLGSTIASILARMMSQTNTDGAGECKRKESHERYGTLRNEGRRAA